MPTPRRRAIDTTVPEPTPHVGPTAAVMLIGNELLTGRTGDANLQHIASRLDRLGIRVMEVRIVPDLKANIVQALNALRQTYTYVLTTGGIGPTHDDITAAAVAQAFGVELARNKAVEQQFRAHYGDNQPDARFKMADLPAGAEPIANPVSIAPGFHIGNVYCMAGIPRVMQAMLEAVVPQLHPGKPVFTHSIDAFVTESTISEQFEAIQNDFPMLELGSYPFSLSGRRGTSLVARGTDRDLVEQASAAIQSMLNEVDAEIRS